MDTQLDLDRQALVLFRQLLELGTEDREALDLEIASLEAPLAERVRRLLEQHHVHTGRLERRLEQLRVGSDVPARLGSFTLLRELGRGGMGVVAEGQREAEGFTQRVAIKWIPAWQVDAARRQRFLFERDVVSRLRHPNIAQLVDGGEGEQGELWYAMELVEGEDLLEHCRERRLDLRARVGLLLDLCSAVSYAHRNLILHRDIKPSNVLVDREGQLKLIDFGIAKGLDDAAEGLTQDAAPMTPRYAAPEQLRGERPTTATDVWQVAAVAFELLSGEPARKDGRTRRASTAALDSDTAHANVERGDVSKALRGDLDAILQRALSDSAEERYDSIEGFAAELRAWLHGEPVRARRGERWYALRRHVAKHRWAVLFGALALVSLGLGLAAATIQSRRAAAEARAAEEANALLLRAFLGGSGKLASTLTLRGYFDYVIDLVAQDTTLPPARRYELLLQLLNSTQDLGVSEAIEGGALALTMAAEDLFGSDALELAHALDRSALVALRHRGAAARADAEARLERSGAIYRARGFDSGHDYLEHLRSRAHLANMSEDVDTVIAISRQMVSIAENSTEISAGDRLGLRTLLASAYFRAQRYADADAAMQGVLEDLAARGADSAALVEYHLFEKARACEYRAFHNAASALEFCTRVYGELTAKDAQNSEMGLRNLRGLAEAQSRLGQHDAALKTLRVANAMAESVYGEGVMPPMHVRILRSLGRETYALGLFSESAGFRRRLLDWSDARRRKDTEDALEMRIELMESLLAAGHTQESADLLDPSLDLSALSPPFLSRWNLLKEKLRAEP